MDVSPERPRRERNPSIDALRGLVMVVMALDHCRDYFGDIRLSPENLDTTTPALFFTRWITHFCAPVFVFLAGVSAWLWAARGRTKAEQTRFLLTRGLWLIVLEFTAVNFGWLLTWRLWGPEGPTVLILQVIAAIGAGMVLLALLIHFPRWVAGTLGLAIVCGHDLLSDMDPAALGSYVWAGQVALWGGPSVGLQASDGIYLIAVYALVPWAGVMAVGYFAGALFARPRAERRRPTLLIGVAVTGAFVLLRYANVYGDPVPWSGQSSGAMTLVSFLNCSKYPPSLAYLLMTLGPALMLLAALDREPSAAGAPGPLVQPFVVFGRVPLFYYLVHIYLIHLGARLYYLLVHGEFLSPLQAAFTGSFPAWFGNGLGVVYASWIAVVVLLYPVCRWFAGVKRRSRSPLLSYL